MEELFQILAGIHPMSLDLQQYLAKTLKTREISKKQVLLKIGHINRNIYFVGQGLFRCFYIREDKEVCSWFMKEMDVMVSVESFFKQIPSYESIQALEDSIVYYVSYDELQFVYNNFPEFNYNARVLAEKYYSLSEQRLYALRMQKAPERYRFLTKYFPELIQRVPSKFLASYLGVTDVTLSNIRGKRIS
jgi:CRP/FNR family transcriptional regulator, anaerobic regulatory protein